MAIPSKNTWSLGQWYDQDVAGNVNYFGLEPAELWNMGYQGGLAHNNTSNVSSPKQIPGTTWALVGGAVESASSRVLKSDGTFWSWGYNNYGEAGTNDREAYSSPMQIGTNTNWKEVDSGNQWSVGVKQDGTLWSWGRQSAGRTGQNLGPSGAATSSPTQLGSGTTWKHCYAGVDWGAATTTNGELWIWGDGGYGQLMNNDRAVYSSPIQVPGTTWDQLAGGRYLLSASKTDGTWYMSGSGTYGGLGQNIGGSPGNSRSSPVQFGAGNTWKLVTLGAYQGPTFGIRSDDTLWVCGDNDNGVLGFNTPSDVRYSSPTQLPGSYKSVWLTAYSSAAVKTDGTLWSWGKNDRTQLGLNQSSTNVRLSSPTQVGTDTNWINIAGNSQYVYMKRS